MLQSQKRLKKQVTHSQTKKLKQVQLDLEDTLLFRQHQRIQFQVQVSELRFSRFGRLAEVNHCNVYLLAQISEMRNSITLIT